jgi:hypothetical protein
MGTEDVALLGYLAVLSAVISFLDLGYSNAIQIEVGKKLASGYHNLTEEYLDLYRRFVLVAFVVTVPMILLRTTLGIVGMLLIPIICLRYTGNLLVIFGLLRNNHNKVYSVQILLNLLLLTAIFYGNIINIEYVLLLYLGEALARNLLLYLFDSKSIQLSFVKAPLHDSISEFYRRNRLNTALMFFTSSFESAFMARYIPVNEYGAYTLVNKYITSGAQVVYPLNSYFFAKASSANKKLKELKTYYLTAAIIVYSLLFVLLELRVPLLHFWLEDISGLSGYSDYYMPIALTFASVLLVNVTNNIFMVINRLDIIRKISVISSLFLSLFALIAFSIDMDVVYVLWLLATLYTAAYALNMYRLYQMGFYVKLFYIPALHVLFIIYVIMSARG